MRESTIAEQIENYVLMMAYSGADILRIVVSAHGYFELKRDADHKLHRTSMNAPDTFMGLPVIVDNFQQEKWTVVCGGKG